MQKVSSILEIKCRNDIEMEVNKLKQNDKMLLGNIMAVIRRSDTLLGRGKESNNGDAYYVIFEPSIYSIVSRKDISLVSSVESKYKLMSIDYYVEQLTEFSFTFMQLAYVGDEIFASDTYKKIIENYKILFKQSYLCNKLAIQKTVSTAIGITKQIKNGKFKNESILRDRLFLCTKVIEIAMNSMHNNVFSIDRIENDYYIIDDEKISTVRLIQDIGINLGKCIDAQKELLGIINNSSNKMCVESTEYKKLKIINKTNILKDLYRTVLIEGV